MKTIALRSHSQDVDVITVGPRAVIRDASSTVEAQVGAQADVNGHCSQSGDLKGSLEKEDGGRTVKERREEVMAHAKAAMTLQLSVGDM